jgi:hypothetical protein
MNFSGKVLTQESASGAKQTVKRFTGFYRAQITGLKPWCE